MIGIGREGEKDDLLAAVGGELGGVEFEFLEKALGAGFCLPETRNWFACDPGDVAIDATVRASVIDVECEGRELAGAAAWLIDDAMFTGHLIRP